MISSRRGRSVAEDVGPALVDGSDTTVWLPTGARARVDTYGTLVVQVGKDRES